MIMMWILIDHLNIFYQEDVFNSFAILMFKKMFSFILFVGILYKLRIHTKVICMYCEYCLCIVASFSFSYCCFLYLFYYFLRLSFTLIAQAGVEQSQLTATSASWIQVIPLPQPPVQLGLKVHITTPANFLYFNRDHVSPGQPG